ncbi:MAG: type III-B CRISPR module RAMP protein Cmr1 [Desulfotomaculum sp.]|nr:type III-B CRISPR module RAMP protein Cmr1 [Desulfotomaculum sp.]
MYTTTFFCVVITPINIAGANRNYLEIRPPSIKGLMRFWWRAIRGDLELETLKKQEAEIFGTAGSKDCGGHKSKVNIRVLDLNVIEEKKKKIKIQVGKNFDNGYKEFESKVFYPGTFRITLMSNDNKQIMLYEYVLAATLILGGLGKRSRRGMGCVKITNIDRKVLGENNGKKEDNFLEQDKFLLSSLFSDEEGFDKRKILTNIKKILNQISEKENYIFLKHEGKIEFKSQLQKTEKGTFIREIMLGETVYEGYENFFKKIAEAAHKNDCCFTGFAKGKKRFASPVYVSAIGNSDRLIPLVTVLNFDEKKILSYEFCAKKEEEIRKQKSFIEEILS